MFESIFCNWCSSKKGISLMEKIYQEKHVLRRAEILCEACGAEFKKECGYGLKTIPIKESALGELRAFFESIGEREIEHNRLEKVKREVMGS